VNLVAALCPEADGGAAPEVALPLLRDCLVAGEVFSGSRAKSSSALEGLEAVAELVANQAGQEEAQEAAGEVLGCLRRAAATALPRRDA
jgi:hypothetical protein